MSQTTAQRAEALIEDAEVGAKDYAARVAGGAPNERNVALNYEVGILRSLVRSLTDSVDMQAESIANQAEEIKRLTKAAGEHVNTISRLRATIIDLRGDLEDARDKIAQLDPPMRGVEDDSRREAVAFAGSTGAADALRGTF